MAVKVKLLLVTVISWALVTLQAVPKPKKFEHSRIIRESGMGYHKFRQKAVLYGGEIRLQRPWMTGSLE